MHFQHPELLYALFLLIIPIIVHLFRLRRFQKEDFTNVKFLKKVIQETRKSSRLKKFLILCTRLLMLACLVIAFAQPYIPASSKALKPIKRLIFLDNSFSMQAPQNDITNLRSAVNGLYDIIGVKSDYDLFTNDQDYFNEDPVNLRKDLQSVEFTQKSYDLRRLSLKAGNYFRQFPNAEKEFVVISDFQQNMQLPARLPADSINYVFIQKKAGEFFNCSIDTAFISSSDPESIILNTDLSTNISGDQDISVSVYDGNQLLGRNTVNFSNNTTASLQFRFENKEIANGIIKVEDNGLRYDNELFFNIGERNPVKVVVISDAPADFLQKIYTQPEFELSVYQPGRIDFNSLNSANLIVLNEVENISASLLNNLKAIQQLGTSLVIIPPSRLQNYDQLLSTFGFSGLNEKSETEKLISEIAFDHPLLEGVFEDRVKNFEYPKVSQSYKINSGNAILRFSDNQPFLVSQNSVYLFAAPINRENSNFLNSPLVVPVFYQFGLQSLKTNQLYYLSNKNNNIDLPVKIESDHVLHLKNNELDIIPQQQNFSTRVTLNIPSESLEAGNYSIMNNEKNEGTISFNFSRKESEDRYVSPEKLENATIFKNIEEYFSNANASSQITLLWKWFVIFALIFLAIEMLLLKFFK